MLLRFRLMHIHIRYAIELLIRHACHAAIFRFEIDYYHVSLAACFDADFSRLPLSFAAFARFSIVIFFFAFSMLPIFLRFSLTISMRAAMLFNCFYDVFSPFFLTLLPLRAIRVDIFFFFAPRRQRARFAAISPCYAPF